MRRAAAVVVGATLLALAAAPARAEFPVALRVSAGGGYGVARHGESLTGPFSGLATLDVAWRRRPGREVVVSCELAAVGALAGTEVPAGLQSEGSLEAEHGAILLGIASTPAGFGIRHYLQGGLGVGRVASTLEGGWLRRPRTHELATGVALSATAGLRLVPDPGPLGFVIALHSSNVMAPGTSSHSLALTVGFTLGSR